MDARPGGREGMSLVEIVVATGLMVVALLGLFSALLGGQTLNSLTRERTQAATQAAAKLEEVCSMPWGTTPTSGIMSRNGETFQVLVTPTNTAGPTLKPGAGVASGAVAVADVAGMTDLRRVTVTVTWYSSAAAKNVSLTTSSLVAKN